MPAHDIEVVPSEHTVRVELDGEVLAESTRALALHETGLPTRYYLPRDDVRTDLLTPTTFTTHCPFKGDASYWTLELDGTSHDGIVWSYETPLPAAKEVAGLMCFYPDRTELVVG